jgi:methyltransferase-like protein
MESQINEFMSPTNEKLSEEELNEFISQANGRLSEDEFRIIYNFYEGSSEKIAEATEKTVKYVRERCRELHLSIKGENFNSNKNKIFGIEDKYFRLYGTPQDFPRDNHKKRQSY